MAGETTVFDHQLRFEDYLAAHAPRKVAKDIDFTSNRSARKYKTLLRDALKAGADFNGHYTVAIWGCGTGCQESKIVDIETGRVIDIMTTGQGVAYRKDSALLIANMPEMARADWLSYCTLDGDNPRFLALQKNRLKPLKNLDCRGFGKTMPPASAPTLRIKLR